MMVVVSTTTSNSDVDLVGNEFPKYWFVRAVIGAEPTIVASSRPDGKVIIDEMLESVRI